MTPVGSNLQSEMRIRPTGRVTCGNALIERRITSGQIRGRRERCAYSGVGFEYPAPAFRIRMPRVERARAGPNCAAIKTGATAVDLEWTLRRGRHPSQHVASRRSRGRASHQRLSQGQTLRTPPGRDASAVATPASNLLRVCAPAIDVWSSRVRTHVRNECKRREPTQEGTSAVTRRPTVARCLSSTVLYSNDN